MELIDYSKTDDYKDFIEKVKLTTKKAKDKFWMRDETLSKIDFPRNHKSVIFIRLNDEKTMHVWNPQNGETLFKVNFLMLLRHIQLVVRSIQTS